MQMNKQINRRYFIAGSAMMITTGIATPSLAANQKSAENLIKNLSKKIFKIINTNLTNRQRAIEFEQIFAQYADVPLIARKSLGSAYRTANPAQRKAYIKAFKGYMAHSYGNKYFKQFVGGSIEITKSKKISGGYLVDSIVKTKKYAPFITQWHVINAHGKDKLYNIFVEGVSMLTDTRQQIGSMLDKRGGSIELLTAHLRTFN